MYILSENNLNLDSRIIPINLFSKILSRLTSYGTHSSCIFLYKTSIDLVTNILLQSFLKNIIKKMKTLPLSIL